MVTQNIYRTGLTKASTYYDFRFRPPLIKPTILYLAIPLNTSKLTNIKRLQRIQNKVVRLITNTQLRDKKRMSDLHRNINLIPINIDLHEQAAKIWEKLNNELVYEEKLG